MIENHHRAFWATATVIAAFVVAGVAARSAGFRLADSMADRALIAALFAAPAAVTLWAVNAFSGRLVGWLAFAAVLAIGGYNVLIAQLRSVRFEAPERVVTERVVGPRTYEVREYDPSSALGHFRLYELVVRDSRFPIVERSLGTFNTTWRHYADAHEFAWQEQNGRVVLAVLRGGEQVGELPRP